MPARAPREEPGRQRRREAERRPHQVAEHHHCGESERGRVCEVLARDVRGGAVDSLHEGKAIGA